jgi:DNA-binding NtrC family response regulator
MERLLEYSWPGNVRELRNLVESMVVLSPGHEIQPEDLPGQIREASARLLPVHVGPVVRSRDGMAGRELEFILRSIIELKLQMEDLRRRIVPDGTPVSTPLDPDFLGEVHPAALGNGSASGAARGDSFAQSVATAIEPPDQPPPPNVVVVTPGTSMADIERAVIQAALRETGGNKRKAARLLDIGERTLYRKIQEYRLPVPLTTAE